MTHFTLRAVFWRGWIGNTEDFTFRIISFPQAAFRKVSLKVSREFLQCFRKIGADICLQRSLWLQRIVLAPSSTFWQTNSVQVFSLECFSVLLKHLFFGKRIAFSVEFLLCETGFTNGSDLKIWTYVPCVK